MLNDQFQALNQYVLVFNHNGLIVKKIVILFYICTATFTHYKSNNCVIKNNFYSKIYLIKFYIIELIRKISIKWGFSWLKLKDAMEILKENLCLHHLALKESI